MDVKRIGVAAILGASLMWAIEPVLAKLSFANADFVQTSTTRAIFVAITALVYTSFTRGSLRVDRAQLGVLLYIALAGTVIADLTYFFALTRIPVVNAVLIGHMQPIFVVLIGFFVLREDILTKFDYLGILLMMVAGLLVTTKTLENLSRMRLGTVGDLFALLATAAWATTGIAMRKYLRNMNAGVITFYRYLTASIVFVGYLLLTSSFVVSNVYQVLVGFVVGAGTILYYEGLKRIKAAQVAALELSTPFFAAVLGFLVLGELVTVMQALGILLLFVGVYFLSKAESADTLPPVEAVS